uniref:ATP synthase subunit a n=1 Tax=Cofana yasumatsui TaxID=2741154 RepID=A0A6M8PF35_9HEMI|nr:ATP synthase F0 subunit 6 [Cofana yasumatsui]QKG63359.1 ATP synthase F0 subunit 6 [Cofana yasumatsui]
MNNLFTVFDPCTGLLSLNWMSTFIFISLLPKNYWVVNNKIILILKFTLKKMHLEIKSLMNLKGSSLIMISIFILIMFNNLMGLLPYIFTSSSHLTFSLALAVPLWLALMLFGWMNKTNNMFTHLVPTGTPSILMPFMVLIETISNLIRPGSLAVRLMANMIAGHLLMSLLGNNNSMPLMTMLMFLFIMMMLFELAVAIIQSYVFMTLMNLYSSEI